MRPRSHPRGTGADLDVPVRILLAGPGETIPARDHGRTLTVTPRKREQALEYLRRSEQAGAGRSGRVRSEPAGR